MPDRLLAPAAMATLLFLTIAGVPAQTWAQTATQPGAMNAERGWSAVARCAQEDSERGRHTCLDRVLREAGLLTDEMHAQQQRRAFGLDEQRVRAARPSPSATATSPASAANSSADSAEALSRRAAQRTPGGASSPQATPAHPATAATQPATTAQAATTATQPASGATQAATTATQGATTATQAATTVTQGATTATQPATSATSPAIAATQPGTTATPATPPATAASSSADGGEALNHRAAQKAAGGASSSGAGVTRSATAAPPAQPDRLEVELAAVGKAVNGRLLVTTTDGAVWLQTESVQMPQPPVAGDRMTIRKGAMGGYRCSVASTHLTYRCTRSR